MSTNQELPESDTSKSQDIPSHSEGIPNPESKGIQMGKALQRRQQRRAQLEKSSNQQEKREGQPKGDPLESNTNKEPSGDS